MIKPRLLQGQLTQPTINGMTLLTLAFLTSSPAWAKKEYISTDPLSIANVCAENGQVSTLKGEKDCIACHTNPDPDNPPSAPDDRNANGKFYESFRGPPINPAFLDTVLAKFCTAEEPPPDNNPPPDDNPTPEAGNGACGYASDTDYSSAPTDSLELCTSGTPSSVVPKDGRFQWTCNGSTEGAKSQVCYTLSSNGKQNQAALTLLPGSTSVKSGKSLKISTTGGSGKGKIKFSRMATGGAKCKLTPSGKKARLKAKGSGVCKITATKASDKAFNDVQAAPITIKVTP